MRDLKNSLAIYCFYDEMGIVDDYVCYALSEVSKVAGKLIVAVNGDITIEGYNKLAKHTSDIIIRNNEGMDAGAYKYTLQMLADKNELNYDEIILLNNSFFGPFISFVEIFDVMRHRNVDFWGLNYIDHKIVDYIQSYFLVFEKKIIETGALYNYLIENVDEYTNNWNTVCATFEIGLFQYLKEKGFTYSTYTCAGNGNLYRSGRISIEMYNLPILKRKNFKMGNNREDAFDAVKWINDNTEYDIELILSNIERTYGCCSKDEITSRVCREAEIDFVPESKLVKNEIYDFVKENEKIYVFGTGLWGQIIYYLFLRESNKMKGFVVSYVSEDEERLFNKPIISMEELDGAAGIILGLNPQNTAEVIDKIGKTNNVLSLWK